VQIGHDRRHGLIRGLAPFTFFYPRANWHWKAPARTVAAHRFTSRSIGPKAMGSVQLEGCKLRNLPLSSCYADVPLSSARAARSRSCWSAGSSTSSGSARRQTRRTSRSLCSATSWQYYAGREHGLGTRPPIAPCWPRSLGCSAVTAGGSSSSRQRHCCAGTEISPLGPGPTLATATSHPTLSMRMLSRWSFAWHERTPVGAICASWASAKSLE
jgi:hypothetical protein